MNLIFVKGPQMAGPDVPGKARFAQALPWVKVTEALLVQEPPDPYMVHLQKVTPFADAHRNPDIQVYRTTEERMKLFLRKSVIGK